jgi:hypothetical protein
MSSDIEGVLCDRSHQCPSATVPACSLLACMTSDSHCPHVQEAGHRRHNRVPVARGRIRVTQQDKFARQTHRPLHLLRGRMHWQPIARIAPGSAPHPTTLVSDWTAHHLSQAPGYRHLVIGSSAQQCCGLRLRLRVRPRA